MRRARNLLLGTALPLSGWLVLTALLLLAAFQLAGPAPAEAAFCSSTGSETVDTDRLEYAPGESIQVTGSGYAPLCDVYVRVTRPDGKVYIGDGSYTPGMDIVTTDAAGTFAYVYFRGGNSISGRHVVDALDGEISVLALAIFYNPHTPGPSCHLTVAQSGPADFTSINAAVSHLGSALGPCTITVKPGTYNEVINISLVNNPGGGTPPIGAATESNRIVLQADPTAPPGSVIVAPTAPAVPPPNPLTVVFTFSRSQFVTVTGFTVTGPPSIRNAFDLSNGSNTNRDITIANNILRNFGSGSGGTGTAAIRVNGTGGGANQNTNTWIYNNLLRNINGSGGITISASTGPTYLVNNTLTQLGTTYGITRTVCSSVYAINNLLLFNTFTTNPVPTAPPSTGILQNSNCTTANSFVLQNNMLYRNTDSDGEISDLPTNTGPPGGIGSWQFIAPNYTTTGVHGTACVYAGCSATHLLTEFVTSNTDFHLVSGSPAIDTGLSSSTATTGSPDRVPIEDFEDDPRPLNGGAGAAACGGSPCHDIGFDEAAASLIVIKHVINDDGQTNVAGEFTMTVSGTAVTGGSDSFAGAESPGVEVVVGAGSYSLSETGPTGYTQSLSADCSGTIVVGQTKTCTVTNDDQLQTGTLQVIKHIINDNGGTASASAWTLTVSSSNGGSGTGSAAGAESPGTTYTLQAGKQYSVTESGGLSGYAATSSSDCTIASAVAGATYTCTITNDDQAATLMVVKHVINDNGGTATAANFTMSVPGGSPASFPGNEGGTTVTLNAGSYSVGESGPSGYTRSDSANCSGSIAVGESKTCTITNDDQAATLMVVKHVINDNGGTATAANFTMSVPGGSPASFPGNEGGTTVTLNAGSYSVGESGPSGYTRSDSANCSGSIAVGETKTCTITNDDQAATLIVVKHVINDNGGTATAANFTMTVTGGSPSPASFPGDEGGTTVTLNAGAYGVSESGPSGYARSDSANCSGSIGVGETKTCTITNDDTAPQTTVDSGPTSPTNATAATFTFSGTDDVTAPGSLTFECQLDGGGFSPCTSPKTYPGPLADGSHTFEVKATDGAANTDATAASHAWTIDATAPDTVIDTAPAATTGSTNATFTFHATTQDGSTTTESGDSFACRLDAGAFEDCTSPKAYTVSPGPHTFQVMAIDGLGNTDPTPASYNWTVDTSAPNTTIDSGPPNPSTSSSATVYFSSNEAGSTFQCSLDAGAYVACSSPATYSGLADGSHTFAVKATDGVGNTDLTPASYTWSIDTTAPDTVIDSAPPASATSTTATFTFHATDGSTNFECSLDGATFASCSSGVTYTGLAVGSHTFQVRAKDGLGNTDPTPASYTWTITPATTPYTFQGFFSPVDNLPVINTVKAGQSIPVKYRLTQNGTPVSDPNSFVSLTSYQVSCGNWSGAPISPIEEVSAPGSSGLQYTGDGNWHYNWKTLSSYATQCRVMVLKLSDGSQHIADFQFKK